MPDTNPTRLSRRAFLRDGSLVLAATALGPAVRSAAPAAEAVRFGLVTDLHYADKPPAGTRHYRETLDKLGEAAARFQKERPTFVAQLGDLIDAADAVETELAYLKRVAKVFAAVSEDRHHVLGNHCVDTLTKDEFLTGVGQKASYYSFDRGGVHFVVLDACFRSDGKPYGRKNAKWNDANVPAAEFDWLKENLKAVEKPVVVLAHQRLDVANDYGVKNAAEVRKVLEGSGKVLCVFQGHSHKNDYKDIAGIHYCTLVAMVEGGGAESSGYAVAEVRADGAVVVTGFRKQKAYEWAGRRR